MSQLDIVYLDTYRKRRDARLRCAMALHTHEPDRLSVLDQLWRAVSLVGGDRAGVIWIDEYGPGLAHPHTVLDLGADRPRRLFSPVPLRSAWETRGPGLLDLPRAEGAWAKVGGGIASACVVAIGSDGPRSWFLVVDSLTPRQPLPESVTGDLMFLAGEIASIVLHRDLLGGLDLSGPAGTGKQALAKQWVASLMCLENENPACGQCRSCQLFKSGAHPDYWFLGLQVNSKTGKTRTEIVIDQVRSLISSLQLTTTISERVTHVPHVAIFFFRNDFKIGNRCV